MEDEDVLARVFAHLTMREVGVAGRVCRRWLRVSRSPAVWQSVEVDFKNFQGNPTSILLAPHNAHLLLAASLDFTFCAAVDTRALAAILPKTTALRGLNVDGCRDVDDSALVHLPASLTRFTAYWNTKLSDDGVDTLARRCGASLTHLSLSGAKYLTDASLHSLIVAAPPLLHLDLTRCVRLTDKAIAKLAPVLPNLHTMLLYACAGLGDVAFDALTSCCPKLRRLDVCGWGALSDKGVVGGGIGKGVSSRLEELNLTWCVSITDASLRAIGTTCTRMRVLQLMGNRHVTRHGLDHVASHCPLLEELDINGCVGLGAVDEDVLRGMFPRFRRLLPMH